jgi:undecaprenyl-diphosphatase
MKGSKTAPKTRPAPTATAPAKHPAPRSEDGDKDIAELGNSFDQEPQAGQRVGWTVLAGAGVLLFAITAYLAHAHTLAGPELAVFQFINGWPDALRSLFLVITTVPESLWIGVVLVLATFSLKLYRVAWQLAAATVSGYAVTFIAKKLIGRERPLGLIHDLHVRAQETGMGFPSGHTMMITVAVLSLWPYLPRRWRWVFLLLIPLMGLSRIYLGVHAPLDVIGGFAVGAVVVGAMRSLPVFIRKFFRLD